MPINLQISESIIIKPLYYYFISFIFSNLESILQNNLNKISRLSNRFFNISTIY
jgi:hypothetical protein